MAVMTKSNLFSESRVNVLALLSDTSKVADPISTSSQSRKWIYSREPDVKAATFKGYPYMILHSVDMDVEQKEGSSVDGKSKMVYWTHELEIVTSDRGYGKNDGQGLTHMEAISDDIAETFLGITNRKTLSGYLMQFANISTSRVVPEVRHSEKCYVRSVLLEFKTKMQVSS